MLDNRTIEALVRLVASTNYGWQRVCEVAVAPTIDSQGEEALRIIINLQRGAEKKITGSAALKTLVEIQNEMQKHGEQRFPIIEYATKKKQQSNVA